MNPVEIFEKHPVADAYRVGGYYSPYCLVSRDKRFSDAELAAEYWQAAQYQDEAWLSIGYMDALDKAATLLRFAALPHYDA